MDAHAVETRLQPSRGNAEHDIGAGVQTAPFVANNGGTPPEAYVGNGMVVMSGNNTRLGPRGKSSPLRKS